MTLNEWLKIGVELGYVGPPVCYMHDGLPTSEEEDEDWELSDPCLHILRLYESPEAKIAIEENHSPSVWRNQWRT